MIRILLTNDDGIDAPGLLEVESVFRNMSNVECWTVAPNSQRSACSHSMSLGKPVAVEPRGHQRYAHSGVVADGVYWAIVHLLKNAPPDLVFSGINKGANLAEDVIYSGTVAGAREAVLRGVHGLAVSLVDGNDFSLAALNAASIAVQLAAAGTSRVFCLNVNYPAGRFEKPGICRLGNRPYAPRVTRISEGGGESYLLGGPPLANITHPENTDVAFIAAGKASITPLAIDQTATTLLDENAFAFLEK